MATNRILSSFACATAALTILAIVEWYWVWRGGSGTDPSAVLNPAAQTPRLSILGPEAPVFAWEIQPQHQFAVDFAVITLMDVPGSTPEWRAGNVPAFARPFWHLLPPATLTGGQYTDVIVRSVGWPVRVVAYMQPWVGVAPFQPKETHVLWRQWPRLALLALALWAALELSAWGWRWAVRRRRRGQGRCARCGYSLRGVSSSTCPECGAA